MTCNFGYLRRIIYPLGNTQGFPKVCNTLFPHRRWSGRWIQYSSTPKTHGKNKDKSPLRRITEDSSKGINHWKYSTPKPRSWKDTSFRQHLYSQKSGKAQIPGMCLIWKFVIYHSRTANLVSNLWCHKWFPYGNLIWVWLIKGIAIFCLREKMATFQSMSSQMNCEKTHPILGNQPPNPSNLHHVIDIAPFQFFQVCPCPS